MTVIYLLYIIFNTLTNLQELCPSISLCEYIDNIVHCVNNKRVLYHM